jgi:hypothetical protein
MIAALHRIAIGSVRPSSVSDNSGLVSIPFRSLFLGAGLCTDASYNWGLLNKLVISNLAHRPVRTLLSVLAIAI